jgi:hypothetical protein
MIIVLLEHIIIGVKLLTAIIIKDKPDWVSKEEHFHARELDHLYELLDNKADEFKEKGGKLLADKINEYKQEMELDYASNLKETVPADHASIFVEDKQEDAIFLSK